MNVPYEIFVNRTEALPTAEGMSDADDPAHLAAELHRVGFTVSSTAIAQTGALDETYRRLSSLEYAAIAHHFAEVNKSADGMPSEIDTLVVETSDKKVFADINRRTAKDGESVVIGQYILQPDYGERVVVYYLLAQWRPNRWGKQLTSLDSLVTSYKRHQRLGKVQPAALAVGLANFAGLFGWVVLGQKYGFNAGLLLVALAIADIALALYVGTTRLGRTAMAIGLSAALLFVASLCYHSNTHNTMVHHLTVQVNGTYYDSEVDSWYVSTNKGNYRLGDPYLNQNAKKLFVHGSTWVLNWTWANFMWQEQIVSGAHKVTVGG